MFLKAHKRYEKHLSVEENMAIARKSCNGSTSSNHAGLKSIDTPKFREKFMQIQVGRYGYEHMREYFDGLPAKKKLGSEWKQADLILERVLEAV